MAGDWIKVELATPDKPEVIHIAAILGIDQDAAFGKCLRVWMWVDQQSEDGNALSVTFAFLDRLTCCIGFGKAMREVGWLGGSDGNLKVPNFQRHNGASAKKRALGKERAERHRNADSVTEALPEKRREEKTREEDKDIPPTADVRTPRFQNPTSSQIESLYQAYPRHEAKGAAKKAIAAACKRLHAKDIDALEYLLERVMAYAKSPSGQPPPRGVADYRPHPASWFNQERYDDDESQWQRPNGGERTAIERGPSRVSAEPGKYANYKAKNTFYSTGVPPTVNPTTQPDMGWDTAGGGNGAV